MLRSSDFNMEYGELQLWVWVETMPRKRTQIGNHSETTVKPSDTQTRHQPEI